MNFIRFLTKDKRHFSPRFSRRLGVLVLFFMLGLPQVSFAWHPNQQYAMFIRDFHLDKVFEFEGTHGPKNGGDIGKSFSNAGVSTRDCRGAISLSLFIWDNHTDDGDDYSMRWAKVYLYDKRTPSVRKELLYVYFSEENTGTYGDWLQNYNEIRLTYWTSAVGATYPVGKRMYSDLDGCILQYFTIYTEESIDTWIRNIGEDNLGIEVKTDWDDGSWDLETHTTGFMNLKDKDIHLLPEMKAPKLETDCGWQPYGIDDDANYGGRTRYHIKWSSDCDTRTGYLFKGDEHKTEDTPDLTVEPTLDQLNNGFVVKLGVCERWKDHRNGTVFRKAVREVKIPPMVWPENFESSYDGTGNITLSWSVPKCNDNNQNKSDFKLDIREEGVSLAEPTVRFRPGDTDYEYVFTIPEAQRGRGNKKYKFRIKRKDGSYFGGQVKERTINTNYREIEKITQTLTKEEENVKNVKLTWNLTSGGIWDEAKYKFILNCPSLNNLNEETQEMEYEIENVPPCETHNLTISVHNGDKVVSKIKHSMFIPKDSVSELSYFEASKGYFPDRVRLDWSLDDLKGVEYFKVFRKEYGVKQVEAEEIARIELMQGDSDYVFFDKDVVVGKYYLYQVGAFQSCDTKIKASSRLEDVGFAEAYGTVSGRIVYEGDVAVKGVNVYAIGESVGANRSLSLNNDPIGVKFTEDLDIVLPDSAGGIQFWAKNVEDKAITLAWNSGNSKEYKWLIKAENFVFNDNGSSETVNKENTELEYNNYIVTYKKSDDQYLYNFYINGNLVKSVESGTGKPFSYVKIYGSGYIDDIRLWHTALPVDKILKTYNNYIPTDYVGLSGYYSCNEQNEDITLLFDLSEYNTKHNSRHVKIGNKVIRESTKEHILPPTKMGILGTTNADGNYVIRYIPYNGEGSQYTIQPIFGSHKFSPSNTPLFFNDNSNTHNNINFTDISSFKVHGQVTYAGTEIPVEGVTLQVDGKDVVRDDQVVKTDEEGNYSITVPIGKHYISVKKDGHTFVNDGRYPALSAGETRVLFNQDMDNSLKFQDETLVRIAGRVSGGKRERNKKIGFGLSKANLGVATVVLEPENKTYSLNTASEPRVSNSGNSDINSKTKIAKKKITITTDAETGEFLALVPPIDYIINMENVKTADEDISFGEGQRTIKIDATRSSKDSIFVGGKWKVFENHARLNLNYRATPEIVVLNSLRNRPVFGDKKYIYREEGTDLKDVIQLITNPKGETDDERYALGHPVFTKLKLYEWKIAVSETYKNPATKKLDIVPATNESVNIDNGFSSSEVFFGEKDSLTHFTGQLKLDTAGQAVYKFYGGYPNLIGDHLINTKISYDFIGKTVEWTLDGYVFGKVPVPGNNFVTRGPEVVQYVLRDPPGSNSYAYLEKGSVIETDISLADGNSNADGSGKFYDFAPDVSIGVDVGKVFGCGISIGIDIETVFSTDEMTTTTNSWSSASSQHRAITLNRRVETSSSDEYVGSMADIYIGESSNLLFGMANYLGLYPASGTGDVVSGGQHSYAIQDSVNLSTGLSFKTTFFYTQNYIINVLIPNLEKLRNELIKPKELYQEGMTVTGKKPVFFSTVDRDDPNFGKDGSYIMLFPPALQNKNVRGIDLVKNYNNWISTWQKHIADNEKAKVESFEKPPKSNYSFDAGTVISESMTQEATTTHTSTTSVETDVYRRTEKGAFINSVGCTINSTHNDVTSHDSTYTTSETETISTGFVLEDPNSSDAFTVDFYDAVDAGGYIFRNRGGQSSCPYEGPEYALYYEPEQQHVLNDGTFPVDVPVIRLAENSQSDISSGREATFQLYLGNKSAADIAVRYKLSVLEGTNPDGLILSIDGMPLTEPRVFSIKSNETLAKKLKVSQSSLDILDYDDVSLIFTSECQDDPTSNFGMIADTVSLSVNFVPSSSPLTLKVSPTLINRSVLKDTLNGKPGEPVVTYSVTDYDRYFKNFASIILQYKNANEHNWTDIQEFINDTTLVKYDPLNNSLIMDNKFSYKFDMKKLVDGVYDLRAVSRAKLGNENIDVYSDVFQVVKDLNAPQVLGNTSPATGILSNGDEISVVFNEDIRSNYITDNFITVKSVLNGTEIDNGVGIKCFDKEIHTNSLLPLSDQSFSIEAWLKREAGQEGTVFAHGDKLRLGYTSDNHIEVDFCGEHFVSSFPIASTLWQYLVFAYDNENQRFSVYVFTTDNDHTVFSNESVAENYNESAFLYLGANEDNTKPLNGYLGSTVIWNIAREKTDAAADNNLLKTGREASLIGYWRFDEGHGDIVRDYARSRHISLPSENVWYIKNDNFAATFDQSSASYVNIPTTGMAIQPNDNFTIEFWFKANSAQKGKTLFSCGDGFEDDNLENKLSIGFNLNSQLCINVNEKQIKTNMASSNVNYLDDEWHHFVMQVVRNGFATIFLDGKMTKQVSNSDFGGLISEYYTLGATRYYAGGETVYDKYFTGEIDEFRLWRSFISPSSIKLNRYNRLHGNERGLVAYFPFEVNYINSFNQNVIEGSPKGFVNGQEKSAIMEGAVGYTSQDVPPLKETRKTTEVDHSFTASERKIVINITEPPARIEGCVLEIGLSRVSDLNENEIDDISWTAYVNQNSLKWNLDKLTFKQEYLDVQTVEVEISNNGGRSEDWSISNIPLWLNVSQTEGVLKPLGRQIITISTVGSTPIGLQETNLTLKGSQGILEQLPVSLKVIGQKPDWVFDESEFDFSMSVIGQLLIDDVPSEDVEDLIGAFVDGVCVGIASPKFYKEYNVFLLMMNIAGNEAMLNKPVKFKVWDASTGDVYPLVRTSEDITVASDEIYGQFYSPVTLEAKEEVEQKINLSENWSWISVNVESEYMTLDSVLKTISPNGNIIKGKAQFAAFNNDSWTGALKQLSIGQMYKIKSNAASQIRYSGLGIVPSEKKIRLMGGWNWLGYTPDIPMPISSALAGLSPDYGDVIKSQSSFAVYSGTEWVGLLDALVPGEGYMYKSKEMQTFTYPDEYLYGKGTEMPAQTILANHFEPNAGEYSGNMSIIAKVKDADGIILNNCELGAFGSNDCRGAAMPAQNDLIFLTVAGDANEADSIRFKVYDFGTGKELNAVAGIMYANNAVVGTLDSPYMITVSEVALSENTVKIVDCNLYPNPNQGVFTVEVPEDCEMVITDVLGSVVLKQNLVAGSNSVSVNLPGVYFVKVTINDICKVIKVVVE